MVGGTITKLNPRCCRHCVKHELCTDQEKRSHKQPCQEFLLSFKSIGEHKTQQYLDWVERNKVPETTEVQLVWLKAEVHTTNY